MNDATATDTETRGGRITLPNGRFRTDFIRDNYYGKSEVSVGKCDAELQGNRSAILKEINAMLKDDGQDEIPYQIIYAATKKQDVVDPRIASAVRRAEVAKVAEAKAAEVAEAKEAKAKAKADAKSAEAKVQAKAAEAEAKAKAKAAKAK